MLKLFAPRSEFSKNTFILIAGTIAAQSIPVLLQPFLRRIYSPEDFGAMAVYLTFFSMISIVSSLRYEAAIILPKNDSAAANILALTFIINMVFCLILFTAILFLKDQIVQLVNFPVKYANYLYFLPFATASFGIYQSMNYWLTRQKAFKASANNKVVRRGIEGAVQATTGWMKFQGGLFIGDFLGNMANVIVGIRQILKNNFIIGYISRKKMGFVLKKYIDFPKYNVIPTLLSNTATVLPFLFINKLYSTETVGYLDLSRLVLSIPFIFISVTVSQVFFQQTTEKKNNSQSIKKDVTEILYFLLAIAIIEIFLVLLLGPQLFGVVFGNNYSMSGSFSQILVFGFVLNFIGSTFSSIFITFGKIRLNSIWQITYFFIICTLFFLKGLSITEFLKIYVAIEILMHLTYCVMIYFTVTNYEKNIRQNLST